MQMRKVRLEGKAWMVKTVRVWKKVKKVKKIREYIEAKKEPVDATCLFTRLESSLVPAGFLTAQFLQNRDL